jgi:hypothetical protein
MYEPRQFGVPSTARLLPCVRFEVVVMLSEEFDLEVSQCWSKTSPARRP